MADSTHISYPRPDSPPKALPPPTPVASSSGPAAPTNRLYVGNLHSTVDESALLKIFSKCGKVSRLDYLFHKSGPQKGKPRGYAFLEFSDTKEAQKAVDLLHDRVIRGRKLIVSFATQSAHADTPSSSSHFGPHRRRYDDASRPTTLSLIKTPTGRQAAANNNTTSKIAALEAKLKQLQAPPSEQQGTGGTGIASLPRKPPPPTTRR